ncbi:protein bark beetle-like [Diaphorina citri]|uniref:Protein bark beetle-like n=1 Tax=Diaphorina citri TaxID=121845 RepID=A0A3Q0JHE9_DIACI|nr:protein bark beetle-like [Diaphorina citri]
MSRVNTTKELVVQERMVLYYKYDNNPSTCVKIFHSAYKIKPFGFRLLQFNLFNTSDSISLYDGSLYNVSAIPLFSVTKDSGLEKKFITTQSPTLSIKLLATGASHMHGFIAEIVTLPISAIGFTVGYYYYCEDSFEGSLSVSWEQPNLVNVENLGGRLMTSLTLHQRDRPYVIKSDLTIMPHVTLTISPGTILEFAPRVGILALGTLIAKGRRHEEIVMRPLPNDIPASTEIVHNMYKSSLIVFDGLQKVRIRRNLLSDNTLAYSLVAGMKTARLESTLDATENWWGTKDPVIIQHLIFDFDDWNDHALVNFAPYLIEDSLTHSER